MSAVYQFPDVAEGQTIEQRVFQLKRIVNEALVDLTDCTIKAEIKSENGKRVYVTKGTIEGGVVINDISTCTVTIEPILIQLSPKTYVWDLTVTYPDGQIKKFAVGKFNVVRLKDFADA